MFGAVSESQIPESRAPAAERARKYEQRVPRYTSYPTAPHFTPAVDDGAYADWLRRLPAGTPASLYLHVPFCASLCWYCGCHTAVVRGRKPIDDYTDLLAREVELVGAACAPEVVAVHWGGGTPNMLGAEGLGRLTAAMRGAFTFSSAAEIAAELDPRILTEAQVAAFAAAGLTRASLGVQDFDPEVQRAINRIQPYEMTARAVEWLRGAGIEGINLDLMYGLPLQTVESVVATVDQAARLMPDRVALFGYAHVPWMKKHQRLLPEDKLPGPEERLLQAEAAAARLVRHGYVRVGLDHFARRDDPMARQLEAGTLRRNFQGYTTDAAPVLLGFGASAIGTLPQGYVQNSGDNTTYRQRIEAGRFATARGIAVTAEDLLRREVIERLMCDLAVDLGAVAAKHGASPTLFAEALPGLAAYAADGLLRRDGWAISVTEAGRPLVRMVCALFDAYLQRGAARHSQAV
jgi:oxygen-independent coproporphyrinogen-3 oxidase